MTDPLPPAPKEPRADTILARWLDWVGDSGARLLPNLRRIAAIDRRVRRLARRKIPGPPPRRPA